MNLKLKTYNSCRLLRLVNRLVSSGLCLVLVLVLSGFVTSSAQNSPYKVKESLLKDTRFFSAEYPATDFTYKVNPQHGTYGAATYSNNTISINYMPDSNYVGRDRFVIEFRTGTTTNPALSEIYYVEFEVDIKPSLMYANEDFYYVPKNSSGIFLNILENDSSTCGYEELNHISVIEHGEYTLQNDSIFYTPANDFTGVSYMHYTVCDSFGTCGRTTVNIVVYDSTEVTPQEELFVSRYGQIQELLAHEGWSISKSPTLGEVSFNTSGNQFTFIPTAAEGLDTFSIVNGIVSIEYIVHIIDVKYNSSLRDDKIYLRPGETVLFDVQENDINGNFYLDDFTQPNIGALTNYWDGRFLYVADSNFVGTQTFEYEVCFWNHCETATVELIIGEFLPDNSEQYNLSTLKNQDLAIAYDVPLDDNSISVTTAPFFGTIFILSEDDTIPAACGSIQGFNGIIYRPLPNLGGVDRFTLEFCSNGTCKEVDFNVHIEHHNYTSCLCSGKDCVWPGDINADGFVDFKDLLTIGYCMGENGTPRLDAEPNEWFAQQPVTWNGRIPHADVDGDGYVTEYDLDAVDNFMGQSHAMSIVKPALLKPYDVSIVLGVDTIPHIGDTVSVFVKLGSATKPAEDVHGFSTSLSFNPDFVDSVYMPVKLIKNSYLTREGATLFRGVGGNGRADIGISRVDREARAGFDVVCAVDIVIEDNLDGLRAVDDLIQIPVQLDNMSVQDKDGQLYTLPSKTEYFTARIPNGKVTSSHTEGVLAIKPTITKDVITVSNTEQGLNDVGRVEVFNIQGQMVFSKKVNLDQDYQIDATNFGSGLHIIKQTSSEGSLSGKFEKL